MTLTQLFKKLGAPLANSRWAWGGQREDGTVFLRVWQDEDRQVEGSWFVRLTYHEKFKDDESNLGYVERLEHIEQIRQGSACYMITCIAKKVDEMPRNVGSFVDDSVFKGGRLIELDGDTWIERTDRVKVKAMVSS